MDWGVTLTYLALQVNPDRVGIPAIGVNDSTVGGVMNTVYFWAAAIAVLIIVIAGFFFVTSRGDPNQVQRAKNAIWGAVIGLIIIIFAFVITQFVIRGVTEGV